MQIASIDSSNIFIKLAVLGVSADWNENVAFYFILKTHFEHHAFEDKLHIFVLGVSIGSIVILAYCLNPGFDK